MKCSKCNNELRKTEVKVYGAKNKVISHQCPKCDYFEFEKETSKKVIEELRGNLKSADSFETIFKRMWKTAKDRGITERDVKEEIKILRNI